MNAILVENLDFGYPGVTIFDQVNFMIKENKSVGIIGPNGGGKTTLLKLLLGFLTPTAGSIKIYGKTVDPVEQKIAYVPQSWKVDHKFPITVLELVLTGLLSQLQWYGKYKKNDLEKAKSVLEELKISHLFDTPIEYLSGGQIQRALLARALVSDPKILLLDEFTAHIDAEGEMMIYSLLEKKKKEMTVLMVTHNLNTAIHFVDQVLCIQNGVLLLDPKEVCEHFAFGLYHSPILQINKEKK